MEVLKRVAKKLDLESIIDEVMQAPLKMVKSDCENDAMATIEEWGSAYLDLDLDKLNKALYELEYNALRIDRSDDEMTMHRLRFDRNEWQSRFDRNECLSEYAEAIDKFKRVIEIIGKDKHIHNFVYNIISDIELEKLAEKLGIKDYGYMNKNDLDDVIYRMAQEKLAETLSIKNYHEMDDYELHSSIHHNRIPGVYPIRQGWSYLSFKLCNRCDEFSDWTCHKCSEKYHKGLDKFSIP